MGVGAAGDGGGLGAEAVLGRWRIRYATPQFASMTSGDTRRGTGSPFTGHSSESLSHSGTQ